MENFHNFNEPELGEEIGGEVLELISIKGWKTTSRGREVT